MIRRVCSICGSSLGEPLEADLPEEHTSHGVCSNCLEAYAAGFGQTMGDFLDSLLAPVFVVDSNGSIVTANALARKTVSKEPSQIEGRPGGDVFECQYARQPGGCGYTIHCRSCVIRNTVMETHQTGLPCVRVAACQDLDTFQGPRRIRFFISTEKLGDTVLLFIDDARPED